MESGNINALEMPLTGRHIAIVGIASLGQFVGTALATVAGVIIPMLNILIHPELSSGMQGLIGSVDLIGICVGSFILGKLSDKYGYLFFFRFCPALILISSLIAIFVPNVWVLIVCLFIAGIGIGGEYSLDSDYITDLMPRRYDSLMVGLAKAASALGNIAAAAICFWIIIAKPDAHEWPQLMWIVAGTALLMLVLRIRFYESPGWLLSKGRVVEAEESIKKFLGKDVYLPVQNQSPVQTSKPAAKQTFSGFLRNNWKRVILSGIPWACEGLGVYGIGVFLPILVMALGLGEMKPGETEIHHVASSVEITFWISCIMLPGFIAGLYFIHKKCKITAIQVWGFTLCAVSLIVLLFAYRYGWNKWVSIGAFMIFEFFLNMGPHLITYVLPPKIYPQAVRGLGVGLAASIGKIGAVLGVFCIPVLLEWGGADTVLIVSAAVMAVGAIVTAIVKVKPIESVSEFKHN